MLFGDVYFLIKSSLSKSPMAPKLWRGQEEVVVTLGQKMGTSLVADDLTSTLRGIFAVIWQVTKAHGVENQACTPHVSCQARSEQAHHPENYTSIDPKQQESMFPVYVRTAAQLGC